MQSNISHSPRYQEASHHKRAHDSQDSKEPPKTAAVYTRDGYVHAKQTANQVERDKDGGNDRDLPEHLVDSIALTQAID